VEEEVKRIAVLIFLLALYTTSFVVEGAESTFPTATRLAPAQKVELILNEREYAPIDSPPDPVFLMTW
jgi:hypothetical protein